MICGNIKLVRWSGDKPLFIISHVEDNRIISATCFDHCHFLDGDSGTSVYVVNGKNILMWNDGDCPSVLLMRNKSKGKLNPLDKATMADAKSIESLFKDLRQSIVNLLYRFYDEERYGVHFNNGGIYSNVTIYSVKRRSSNKHFLSVIQGGNELKLIKNDDSVLIVDMNNIIDEVVVRIREFTSRSSD